MDRVVDDARLLGRADHRGVEGLGDQQVDDGHRHVRAAMDVHRRVARADGDARFARGVGGGDGLRAARRPDQVHARVVEEVLRGLQRRVGNDLQRVLGQAFGLAGALEDLDRARRAARGPGGRAEDDGIAGLGRDDRFEQRGRGRVGDRQQRQHDADRLGHIGDRALGVLADDADRALVLQVVVQELGGHVVLDHLVLEHAEAGLLERQLGQLDGGLQPGDHHRADDPIDVRLLVDGAERARGRLGALDRGVPARDRLAGRRLGRGAHRTMSRERRASASSSRRNASASGCGSGTIPASVRKPTVTLPA